MQQPRRLPVLGRAARSQLRPAAQVEAAQIAGVLNRLNRERQDMELRCCEEAVAIAEERVAANPELPILIVGSEAWHKGLVGLVASRLTERFRRPAFVMAWDSEAGTGTGSGRSIAGADIGRVVRAALEKGLARKGGGHAMAAGITIERGRLTEIEEFFFAELSTSVAAARDVAALSVDGALTPEAATPDFADLLEKAGPYGAGNPAPRFVFPAHRVNFAKLAGEAHIRCSLKSGGGATIGAIAFRSVGTPLGDALLGGADRPLHIAGRLQRDSWGGRDRVEVMIEDVADPMRRPR